MKTLTVSDELHTKIDAERRRRGMTIADLADRLLRRALADLQGREPPVAPMGMEPVESKED